MRSTCFLALSASLLLALGTAYSAGCGLDAEDCELALTCASYAEGGPPSVDCGKAPSLMSGGPDTSCGVFAAPSAKAGGDGSKQSPLATLQAAVDQAFSEGKPVYACGEEFDESVHLPSGVIVYGGLDCAKDWAWTAGKRTLLKAKATAAAGATEVAVRLSAGAGKTRLQDVDVTAPDGAMPGVSSVAILIEDTAAELTRSDLTAGDGTPGADGAQSGDDPLLDGVDGVPGFNICGADATNPAPAGPTKTCGALTSVGGQGGDGGVPTGASLDGGDGKIGAPQDPASPGAGLAGKGQSTMACTSGVQGADGAAGPAGSGAAGKGGLSTSGYAGVDGADGTDGAPGQGGGGGGGAKGKLQILCTGLQTKDRAGATGGSGGTGGCGGARGGGGKAGGSSIALLSVSKQAVSLTSVILHVGAGGDGGKGGDGQKGGSNGSGAGGGQGANGASTGCAGGDGGQGGAGGPGGGGIGGHAIGVAYQGAAPTGVPVVHYKGPKAAPGLGGAPGAGSTATMGQGESGVGGDVVDFTGP